MNRIYIEPPAFRDDLNNAVRHSEWRHEQISKLYEAIAKLKFMDATGARLEIDAAKLGEILLALVKLQEMK